MHNFSVRNVKRVRDIGISYKYITILVHDDQSLQNTCDHKKKLFLQIFPLPRSKYTISPMNMLQSYILPANPHVKMSQKVLAPYNCPLL